MMRYLFVILLSCSLFSCSEIEGKKFNSIKIEPVFTDSLSIRAIHPLNENRVWFAANHGKVGLIDYQVPKLATIKYEDKLLNFRSIASTKNSVFVLSIENPAVLYKIGFNEKEATSIEEVYVEKNEKVFYDAMAFWDDKEGIAIGDATDDCFSIIMTKDGGNSWKKLSCDVLPKIKKGEAAFAASNSNIALYNNHVWVASGGTKARVFHSSNRGVSWEVFETPILQGKAMTGIYSIDFFDENKGIVFGGDWEHQDLNEGNKAITNDGGKTWKLIANGRGPGYRSSVKFMPNSNGRSIVAVGSKGISYSYDFGETWKQLSNEGFYAIEFVNDSIAFASGRNKISKLLFK